MYLTQPSQHATTKSPSSRHCKKVAASIASRCRLSTSYLASRISRHDELGHNCLYLPSNAEPAPSPEVARSLHGAAAPLIACTKGSRVGPTATWHSEQLGRTMHNHPLTRLYLERSGWRPVDASSSCPRSSRGAVDPRVECCGARATIVICLGSRNCRDVMALCGCPGRHGMTVTGCRRRNSLLRLMQRREIPIRLASATCQERRQ